MSLVPGRQVVPMAADSGDSQEHSASYATDKNIGAHVRNGEVEDVAILAAFQGYLPGTIEERRLVRRIDCTLLPVLWLMYVLAHLDRSNIANANAAGMSEGLGLSDNRESYLIPAMSAKRQANPRKNMQCSCLCSSLHMSFSKSPLT